jgi:hypothetical protein
VPQGPVVQHSANHATCSHVLSLLHWWLCALLPTAASGEDLEYSQPILYNLSLELNLLTLAYWSSSTLDPHTSSWDLSTSSSCYSQETFVSIVLRACLIVPSKTNLICACLVFMMFNDLPSLIGTMWKSTIYAMIVAISRTALLATLKVAMQTLSMLRMSPN